MEEFHKLWKHHAKHIKELCQRNEHMDQQINEENPKFQIGHPVMIMIHACHTFEPKYLLDQRKFKILNDSTLLLVTPNGKERKTNINGVKPCSTTELVENAWDSFLDSIKKQTSKF